VSTLFLILSCVRTARKAKNTACKTRFYHVQIKTAGAMMLSFGIAPGA